MTEFEIKHGLSQDEPGPLEPVELAQHPGAAPATGNTARDQEMYAAGIRTGEENAKHNAAIRAATGWLPIESAPKDSFIFDGLHHYGTKIIVFDGSINTARWWRIEGDSASNFIDEGGRAIYPTHWMPLPAAPGADTPEEPITVALDPDPRGVSVGVWQGSHCIYSGAHAVPGNAQDEDDSIALDKLADYIADTWPDTKYGLEEICQRLHAMWPGEFLSAADLEKNDPNVREALRALLLWWDRFQASDGDPKDACELLVKGARSAWQFAEVEIDRVPVPAPAAGDALDDTDRFRAAYMEWQEKTDFIQERLASGELPVKYLGWHRADVMRDLIDLASANSPVVEALDARRYRAIRNPPYSDRYGDLYAMTFQGDGDIPLKGDALDAAADAALAARVPHKGEAA